MPEVCEAPDVAIDNTVPVVMADAVIKDTTPVVAVEARSSSVPVVVPVSTEVDVKRSNDVPAPNTDVAWEMLSAVPAPFVRALFVMSTVSPAVVLTPVIPSVLPLPVVLEPVMLTAEPVKPVVTPDCVIFRICAVVWFAFVLVR